MRVLVLATGLLLLLVALAAPVASQQPSPSPVQELADRYAPVMYVREQEYQCATPPHGGEPYLPVPVEMVVGNERVLVRDATNDDRVIATGPDAAELATYGSGTYMDFPGDPRRPGCTYEFDERLRTDELGFKPTTYVHIVHDEDGQRLALQYWFFWYFNHWNNTHEADWEMIQIFWDDVDGIEGALERPPDRVGYSQHGNGELATWGDEKIQLDDGTHPRVYPAAGSHASFYSQETFLAWGENRSGFGCDVTLAPSVPVQLSPVIVPDEIDPDGEFAWLLYEGIWGERQPGPFNGIAGAGFNSRWIDPWAASENWRPFSIVVPGSNTLGPTMTDAFCGLTELGSRALIYTYVFPWIGIPLLVVVIGALAFFFNRSRRFLRRAIRLYVANWRLFVGIGLVAIPIGVAFNLAQAFFIGRDPLEYIIEWFDSTAGARLSAILAVVGMQQLAMLLIIAPAVIQAVADLHRGQAASIARSYRLAATRAVPIAVAFLLILILAGLPLLFVIGLPLTIWLVVRWQFFVQVLVFDQDETSTGALRESARLVWRRWWKTLFAVFIFDLLATAPGVLVGFGLLTLGRTAVGFANAVSSVFYALAIPVAVIAVTMMYLDRKAELTESTGTAVASRKESDLA